MSESERQADLSYNRKTTENYFREEIEVVIRRMSQS